MILDEWAARWQIPAEAVVDLRRQLGADPFEAPRGDGAAGSETAASNQVLLEASAMGIRLWRNNVGAAYTADGHMVRYGLANPSKAVNQRVKSSDLIGIRPRVITPGDVGKTIGQFVAREMKRPGWTYRGTPRERAQRAFLTLVLSMGADARFATGPGSL